MKTYQTVLLGVMHQCHTNSTLIKITKIQCKKHAHHLGFYLRQLEHEDQGVWGGHVYPLHQEELILSAVCKKALKGRNGFRDTDLFILTKAYLHYWLVLV